jgi:diadenosine tetraphosphatase ApaH/serine/threonine PP2A family protein phosphatase
MKILVLSDSHGNKFGLEAVLDSGRDYDRIVCLGDVVGYGAHPNECCEILRQREAISLSGNHDAAVLGKIDVTWFNPIAQAAVSWTREHLKEENRLWLDGLPAQQVFAEWGFQAVHASLREPWEEYIIEPTIAEANLRLLEQPLCFFGHTHVALCVIAPADTSAWTRPDQMEWIELPFGAEIQLEGSERVLLNPGSCGQPRDGNPQAKAAIYDTESQTIEVFGVEYDAQAARAAILKVGLPARLGDRLLKGQ